MTPAPLVADKAQYIYDDLGRLVQVIDGQGSVAEYNYNYDAVGNLLPLHATRVASGLRPLPV
ncbi:MAG: RHS repeat domain-containing protein [Nitrospirales bacterium]